MDDWNPCSRWLWPLLTLKHQWFCSSVNFWELSSCTVWMHLCVGTWRAEYHWFIERVLQKSSLRVKHYWISCLATAVTGSPWVGLLNMKYKWPNWIIYVDIRSFSVMIMRSKTLGLFPKGYNFTLLNHKSVILNVIVYKFRRWFYLISC